MAVSQGARAADWETQTLVQALRAPQVRGQWGELQLQRVVELAGMVEHCDFVQQASVNTDAGRLRPDMVIRLPGKKIVIVDSKAPLSAYLDAVEATDETQRCVLMDQHAKQVRDHIQALSTKDYANQFTEAPDFVVMFLPGESFFSAACQRDPNLIEFAIRRNDPREPDHAHHGPQGGLLWLATGTHRQERRGNPRPGSDAARKNPDGGRTPREGAKGTRSRRRRLQQRDRGVGEPRSSDSAEVARPRCRKRRGNRCPRTRR